MKRLLVSLAAAAASVMIAAPAHATITGDQYGGLEIGQTRWHVRQVTGGDGGCRVGAAMYAGKVYLRKIYKVEANSALWVVIDYVKSDLDSPFRLAAKHVTPDLQLAGITSYHCPV